MPHIELEPIVSAIIQGFVLKHKIEERVWKFLGFDKYFTVVYEIDKWFAVIIGVFEIALASFLFSSFFDGLFW